MEDGIDPKVKLTVLKAQAVRQALVEIISEHRDEIVERAAAKLTAMGIEVTAKDLEGMNAPVP